MKRKQTTTTKEYDNEGRLLRETVEEVVEEDNNGTIYPQYPTYPIYPSIPQYPFYKPEITCKTDSKIE